MKKLITILMFAGLALYFACREYPNLFGNNLASLFSLAPQNPQQTGDIQKHRQRIDQLEAQLSQTTAMAGKLYNDISALQISSNAADPVAIAKLKSKAAAFESVNARAKELSRALDAEKQQLNAILTTANTATLQAASTPPPAPKPTPTPRKRVIMYTSSGCSACAEAKAYLSKKGVFYSEVDIDKATTTLKEEFKSLGGHSVPLILIGEKRIEGYSEAEIDRALQ